MNNINTKALTTIGVSADYIMSLSENVKLKKVQEFIEGNLKGLKKISSKE